MTMLFRAFIISLLLLSTTACVPVWQTKPTSDPESLFKIRAHTLTQIHNWEIQGRTVITQGKEGWNVGLYWQEKDNNYQIKLTGPFSQGGVTLDGNQENVTLTMSNGKQFSASTPEKLIADIVGWKLPVSALRDWVRGLPYSEQSIDLVKYNDDGKIIYLEQQGWSVEFKRYIPFENYSMPAKVFIKHPELSIRLIIADWDRP